MNAINLMPVQRRLAKARRRRIMKWAGALGVYCLALLLGCVLSSHYVPRNDQGLEAQAMRADTQLKAARTRTAVLNEDIAKANQRLQTVQAIQQHPDWGTMLDLVARNLGNTMVLDSCRLQAIGLADKENKPSPDAAKQADGASKPIVLEITGLAKNHSDVSDYMLRLEKLRLFSKIRLIKTSHQVFLNDKATTFHLECLVSGDEGNVQ